MSLSMSKCPSLFISPWIYYLPPPGPPQFPVTRPSLRRCSSLLGGGVLDELLSASVIKRHDQEWLVEERVHFWLLAPAGSKSIMVGKARQQDLEQEAEGSHLQPHAEGTESKPEVW